jgi:hypothetical protein
MGSADSSRTHHALALAGAKMLAGRRQCGPPIGEAIPGSLPYLTIVAEALRGVSALGSPEVA